MGSAKGRLAALTRNVEKESAYSVVPNNHVRVSVFLSACYYYMDFLNEGKDSSQYCHF